MEKNFTASDWESYIPQPICEQHPEYGEFYRKAWKLVREHVKDIPGMPQTPYMDEGFCDTQLWIWDTCFMSLFCKFAQSRFPGVESFQNFYAVLHGGKSLPAVIPTENEPHWTNAIPGVPYTLRVHIPDNPPLFAWGEYENALLHGDKAYLKALLYEKQSLQHHYEWFESLKEKKSFAGVFIPNKLLCEQYGYKWEGGCSGMDNTPRGRTCVPSPERPNNPDMLWLDAICQQALSAKIVARLFTFVGDTKNAQRWTEKFEEKKRIVNKLYWDDEDAFYYDIDSKTHAFYKVKTVASFWPLIAGIASEKQAAALISHVLNPETFGGNLPFPSLARNDAEFSESGKYWRGSMWLPTAYATLRGMTEYGYHEEAAEAGFKIFDYMLKTYQSYEPHSIWECYAPVGYRPATDPDGIGTVRKDFCGWSALGPISVYLEYVLGFRYINAFDHVVKWDKPDRFQSDVGIKNLRFGNVITDIIANQNDCRVISNAPYTLEINGERFAIRQGENRFSIGQMH